MALWWKKKPQEASWRQCNLPGGIGSILLPDFLQVGTEDGQTLMGVLGDLVTLRCSTISFNKPGESGEDTGKNYVRQKAGEEGLHFYEVDGKAVLCFEESSEQDGQRLLIHYWYVGARTSNVIISATMLRRTATTAEVQNLLNLIPRVVESVKINLTYKIASYDGHAVPITEQTGELFEQQVRPIGLEDEPWLERCRELSMSLGRQYRSGGHQTPDELNTIFSRWMFDDDEKESSESVANALGTAFGDFLVEQHGFRWVVISDQYGTEYCREASSWRNDGISQIVGVQAHRRQCANVFSRS